MALFSINQFSELAKLDRRTVKARLSTLTPQNGPKGAHLYDLKDALPLLVAKSSDGDYDLEQERARLAHHQANNEALKELVMKKALIPADEVKAGWITLVTRFKAKMLSIPSKMAHQVAQTSDHHEIEQLLRVGINEALTELASEQ